MTTTSEYTNEAREKQTEAVETIITLYTASIERVAEAQKKTLDLAVQQNADLIGAWKKIAQVTPGTPVSAMLDLAANTFGPFVDMQKGAIDLAVGHTQTLAGFATEHLDSASKTTDGVRTMMQNAVERAAATQKNVIEFCAAQTKTAFDTFKKQPGVAGSPVEAATESVERGFDSLVETQKEMLSLASKRSKAEKVHA